MDPVTHRRMRTAHLNHSTWCVCGRQLRGNGEKTHRRACRANLAEHGWPLQSSWIETFVSEGYPGAETAKKVELGLGRWALEHEHHGHPGQPNRLLSWAEFKQLVWTLADSPP